MPEMRCPSRVEHKQPNPSRTILRNARWSRMRPLSNALTNATRSITVEYSPPAPIRVTRALALYEARLSETIGRRAPSPRMQFHGTGNIVRKSSFDTLVASHKVGVGQVQISKSGIRF